MNIDWKKLATTVGYKSLKAAYIDDIQKAAGRRHPMRSREEFLRLFQWVISRAKHYSHHTGESVEAILNKWEGARNYWWLNFYQDCRQPKFCSGAMKKLGTAGFRKQLKKSGRSPAGIKESMQRFTNTEKSNKTKPRWPMARKKRGY